MLRNLVLLLLALALFSFSACSTTTTNNQPTAQYPNCDTDAQCTAHGQLCLSGRCVQCKTKADCPKACDRCAAQHICRPILNCCTKDSDCGALRCGRKFGAATGICK